MVRSSATVSNSSKQTSSPGIKSEVRDAVERVWERGTGRGRDDEPGWAVQRDDGRGTGTEQP